MHIMTNKVLYSVNSRQCCASDVYYVVSTGGFEDPALYTSWLSSAEAFNLWKSPVPFNKYEKCATLVSNSQALLRPLDNMVGKAWNMFASR